MLFPGNPKSLWVKCLVSVMWANFNRVMAIYIHFGLNPNIFCSSPVPISRLSNTASTGSFITVIWFAIVLTLHQCFPNYQPLIISHCWMSPLFAFYKEWCISWSLLFSPFAVQHSMACPNEEKTHAPERLQGPMSVLFLKAYAKTCAYF